MIDIYMKNTKKEHHLTGTLPDTIYFFLSQKFLFLKSFRRMVYRLVGHF